MEQYSRPVGNNDRHVGDANPIWAYCTQLSSESDQEPLDEALQDYIDNASPIDSDEIAVAKSLANFHIKMGQQNFFLESDEAITDSNSSTFKQNNPSLKKCHHRSSADSNSYTPNHCLHSKMLPHHDKRRNGKKKYRHHHVTNLVQQNANKDFIEDGELADVEVGTISKVLVNKNRHHDRHNYMLPTDRMPGNHNMFTTTTKAFKMDPSNSLHRKAINKLGHRWSLDSKRAFCEEESQINSGNDRQRKMKIMRKTGSKQSNNSASEMEIDYNTNSASNHSITAMTSYPLTNDICRSQDVNPSPQNSDAIHDTLMSRTSDMSSSSDSDIVTSDGEISYYETGVEGDDEQSCCEAAFAKWWQDDPTSINDMRLLASDGNFREMKPGTLTIENNMHTTPTIHSY